MINGTIQMKKHHLIKEDINASKKERGFISKKQKKLMKRYKILEEIQGEYLQLYYFCQNEMDKIDGQEELVQRKLDKLEEKMASVKFEKGFVEWKMFQDYWRLCQKFWEPEENDEYWDNMIKETN